MNNGQIEGVTGYAVESKTRLCFKKIHPQRKKAKVYFPVRELNPGLSLERAIS
jgi:hypothetical protein